MVRVVVPNMLAAQAAGRKRFEVEAATVGDALSELPVADLLFNERGELNQHLNVYVDGDDVRDRGGLAYPLADASEIRVVAMVSGGEPRDAGRS
jgi:molybdopterin converting factor small subunit